MYLTTSEKPIYPPQRANASRGRWGEKGYTEHCLKRIAFEDENVWIDVSKEIEVMVGHIEAGLTEEITPTFPPPRAVPRFVTSPIAEWCTRSVYPDGVLFW